MSAVTVKEPAVAQDPAEVFPAPGSAEEFPEPGPHESKSISEPEKLQRFGQMSAAYDFSC